MKEKKTHWRYDFMFIRIVYVIYIYKHFKIMMPWLNYFITLFTVGMCVYFCINNLQFCLKRAFLCLFFVFFFSLKFFFSGMGEMVVVGVGVERTWAMLLRRHFKELFKPDMRVVNCKWIAEGFESSNLLKFEINILVVGFQLSKYKI